MGGGRATLRGLSHPPGSQSPMRGLSHPQGPKPPTPSIPSPLAIGCLAGDPDPNTARKNGVGAKNRVKKGKKQGREETCRSKGRGGICAMGPSKALFLTEVLTEIIILNLCRSALALEELRNELNSN